MNNNDSKVDRKVLLVEHLKLLVFYQFGKKKKWY